MSQTSVEPDWVVDRRTFAAAHPQAATVYAAAERGDWATIAQTIASATHPADRTFLIRRVADVPGTEVWLDPVAQSDPLAAVVMAEREVVLGWEVRGHAHAEQTPAERFEEFRVILVRAERRLTRVIAAYPDLGDAWVTRLTTAMGLELHPSEATRRFRMVQRHSPDNLWAHLARVTYLAPKWFGSWEECYGFADEAARTAPPDSPVRTLPIVVHLERWLELGGGTDGQAYLQQPAVSQALVQAAQVTYRPTLGWARVENTFAMLYALAGAHRYAAVHFGRLGDLVTSQPWGYLGDPWPAFTRLRGRTREATP